VLVLKQNMLRIMYIFIIYIVPKIDFSSEKIETGALGCAEKKKKKKFFWPTTRSP